MFLFVTTVDAARAIFGLSLAIESQTIAASTTGGIRGSLRWLAPEFVVPDLIVKADKKDMRPRDVYAFGCTASSFVFRCILR
jgi:hypothetical protein